LTLTKSKTDTLFQLSEFWRTIVLAPDDLFKNPGEMLKKIFFDVFFVKFRADLYPKKGLLPEFNRRFRFIHLKSIGKHRLSHSILCKK